MILKESEIDKDTINSILGKPYKEPGKWFTVTGSNYYFIKQLIDYEGNSILIWEDSKGIFQRHEKGLALYVNRSNYQRVILLFFDTIQSLELKISKNETPHVTMLTFKTSTYSGEFITNFSDYNSQFKFFSKMGLLKED